jgi:hypothetical protein
MWIHPSTEVISDWLRVVVVMNGDAVAKPITDTQRELALSFWMKLPREGEV